MLNQGEITSKKIWGPFTLNVSMVILLIILGVFIGLFINNKRIIEAELQTRARSHFNNIVLTRRWNAQHGGVYVEKRKGVVSNPYLENPDIQGPGGKIYTKKNPALMTREISELAALGGGYQFHITSLLPLNPDNKPDAFEKNALQMFEQGEPEVFKKVKEGGTIFFRYMAPLYVEESCLQCHAKQGYVLGDVRGGISVKFDIAETERKLAVNRRLLIALFLTSTILLLGLIYFYIIKLFRKLNSALGKIQLLATTDDLTGLYNRRFFFERLETEILRSVRHGHEFSCILLDLDHFKKINDTHGHDIGDLVLLATGTLLRENCRKSDVAARYGGEEFILLLPECGEECARATAEKLRSLIEGLSGPTEETVQIKVTASFGVASYLPSTISATGSISQLVKQADRALYRAKANGRNRVEVAGAAGDPKD